jgi:hypothetical protein
MTIAMQPIYTQTASGSAASIVFNNIPQTFTDFKLVISGRGGQAQVYQQTYLRFNGDSGTNYSTTTIQGTGSGVASYRESNQNRASIGLLNGANATTSTFGNYELYVANYSGANFKSWIVDSITENNATLAYQGPEAGLWRNTAAITSMEILTFGANFVANSTFTLYGITKG